MSRVVPQQVQKSPLRCMSVRNSKRFRKLASNFDLVLDHSELAVPFIGKGNTAGLHDTAAQRQARTSWSDLWNSAIRTCCLTELNW